MNQLVKNGVGQCRIAQVCVPLVDGQLAGDYGEALAMAVVEEFQEIAPVLRIERGELDPRGWTGIGT